MKNAKKIKKLPNNKPLYLILSLLIFILFFSFTINSLRRSLFFSQKDRIDVIVYGKHPTFYSIGLQDNVHYSVQFYPDLKVLVPGGYGYYRIGALGKLISLEHKPELLQKTFSYAMSTFIDYFFYTDNGSVYYGGVEKKTIQPFLGVKEFLSMQSNSNWFDKLYFILFISDKHLRDFKDLGVYSSFENFSRVYKGYLYSKIYRNEQKSVKILYTDSYKNAEAIAEILEGNGIKVSDISIRDATESKKAQGCEVKENATNFSVSAQDMSAFFNCTLKRGDTEIYDIIFNLGDREKDWAAQ